MNDNQFRLTVACCAIALVVIAIFFHVEKSSNDERAAIAWERLADWYAPQITNEYCVQLSTGVWHSKAIKVLK